MVSTVKEFIHSSASAGSHKRKRDGLSDSDVDEHEGDDAITESVDLTEACEELISADKPPEQLPEGEESFLAELSKIYDSEGAVSDAVSTQLANLVDKMAKNKLSEANAKDKLAKYNRPQNCENLVSTRVNPQIWVKMRSSSKSRDLRLGMQKIETSMLKSMHPIISLTGKLLSLKSNPKSVSKEDVSSFLRLALDSLTLMANFVYEFNLSRRELIRPDLNEEYKQLCSSQTPTSKFLFGDDLPKAVKEISETNKVSQRLSYPKHGTNSKHGANNFIRQGSSYSNHQQHFCTRAKANGGNLKVAHDQLGSQVSLPFSPSIPCMAGRLKNYVHKWHTITSDQSILDVRGVTIDFITKPTQRFVPNQYKFNPLEIKIIDEQIACFLERGVIERATHSNGECISNMFIRPKKDGSYRLILNLKQLNESVEYHHFKMENLRNAITHMTPNCFMASIDLNDAYYSVSVNKNHRKYLRFIWKHQLFQFTCLPNGLKVVLLEYLQKSLNQFMQRFVPKDLKMWATLMTPIFREAL